MIKKDVRIISFNVRGLGNSRKRIAVFSYLKKYKCDLAFLQETFSSSENEIKWSQQWGGGGHYVHGTNHSRGVAILWRNGLDIEIFDKKLDVNGRFIVLKCSVFDTKVNLINVYVPNKESGKIRFINDINKVLLSMNIAASENNLFGGDWNITMDKNLDKLGGVHIDLKSRDALQHFSSSFDLEDVWRLKHENLKRYTWQQRRPRIHSRLDYF